MKNRNRAFILFVVVVLLIGALCGGSFMAVVNYINNYDCAEAGDSEDIIFRADCYTEAFTEELKEDKPAADGVTNEAFAPVDCELSKELQFYTYNVCRFYNVDFYIAMALMRAESSFDAEAVSETADYGLMQINICNHEMLKDEIEITDIMDERQNICAGLYILNKHIEKYNSVEMALMAYKLGERGAAELWENGIYETQYTANVLAIAEKFRNK